MRPHRLETLFNPQSIAVVGASESSNSVGARIFGNLISGGFSGNIIPVNPKHSELGGRRCHASLRDVDEHVDLAVIATPARTISEIIQDCGTADVGAAIVLSAGFGETGKDGKHLEAMRLARAMRAKRVLSD